LLHLGGELCRELAAVGAPGTGTSTNTCPCTGTHAGTGISTRTARAASRSVTSRHALELRDAVRTQLRQLSHGRPERTREQHVRELRIPRQRRPVHVRRDHRTLHRALVALLFLAVLYYDVSSLNTVRVRVSDHPAAGAHDAQRAGIGTKDGRAHVVGEAGEGLGEFAQVSGQRLGVGARVHAARTRVTSTRTVTTTR